MVGRKSPREKKELEYSRDRRSVAEYPKAWRKGKPRKKKRANHLERRRADRKIAHAITLGEEAELTDAALKPRSRSDISNMNMPLSKFIARQKERRAALAETKPPKRAADDQMQKLLAVLRGNNERFKNVSLVGWASTGPHVALRFEGSVLSPAAMRELKKLVSQFIGPQLSCDLDQVRIEIEELALRRGKKVRFKI